MRWTALLLVAALMACGGTSSGDDAGPDAGARPDAGQDAGIDDLDAGSGDGGVGDDAGSDAGADAGDADAGGELPPQVIEAVLPPRGGSGGGTQVVLRGSGFLYGVARSSTAATRLTSISFGNNPAQDFLVVDDRSIDVKAPPGLSGPQDVRLTSPRGTVVCTGCFTYEDELFLTGASPREGPSAGGTIVVLTGQGFTPDAVVLFGTQRSPGVTFVSSTELHALSPRAVGPDAVDLVVYDRGGLGQLRRGWRYQTALRLHAVGPAWAPLGAPGVELTLTGSGLDASTSVRFGGVPAQVLGETPEGGLRVAPPLGVAAGALDVTVQRGDETWTLRQGFTWVDPAGPAAVLALSPRLLDVEGGVLEVVGQGLAAATQVRVDGLDAPLLQAGSNRLTVQVPPRSPGASKQAVVSVALPTGNLDAAVPLTWRLSLGSASPQSGASTGGGAVTVSGAALPFDAQVSLGALPATGVQVLSDASLSLVTPPVATGRAEDLWVRSAGDPEDEDVLPAAFLGKAPVALGRVVPDVGAIAGNTLVTVFGEGFEDGTVVFFGAARAKDIKVLDAHTLTCRIPVGEVGTVDVRVTRPGESDTLATGFSYVDPTRAAGGLSGGPLGGTLNVTVLDVVTGQPVPLMEVMLGADSTTPLQGETDARGQVTFSDPSLVKAQVVTVSKPGFSSTTVTGVSASNLTVFVNRTSGTGMPEEGEGDGGGPILVPPSMIAGRVSGFKAPRPLLPGERLEARVFIADNSLYATPPYRAPGDRRSEQWKVTRDGGEYRLYAVAGRRAVYAILGIVKGESFTPHLMGLRRNIPAAPDRPQLGMDIVLDMHLTTSAPITLEGPVLQADASVATTLLYAWLDLGAEGFVPNPYNWNTGTAPASQVLTHGEAVAFPGFPSLDGSNFLFAAHAPTTNPVGYSMTFRRQPGALADGVTIGPMLPVPRIVSPTSQTGMEERFAWLNPPGATPDLTHLTLYALTPFGSLRLWQVVLPGTENQVQLPAHLTERLRREWSETDLMITLTTSRQPRFRYEQWSYQALSTSDWTSFSTTQSGTFRP